MKSKELEVNKPNEFVNFSDYKSSIEREPGHICDCIFGSPKPGVIVFRADLHERNCPFRRKIVDASNGYNTTPFPFNDD